MKFCQSCGAEINDNAVVCVKCGCSIKPVNQVEKVDDTVSVGLVILAVLIPIFGVIYWPVKAKTRPRCAKVCGIAAIISWIVCFLFGMMLGGY